MTKRLRLRLLLLAAMVAPCMAHATCFERAEAAYAVPQRLLRAVAQVESGLRDLPPSWNADGSYDIGIMRINSRWLPSLQRYGITRAALDDPCQNLIVGAWILAQNKQRLGPSWNAVGAYNVGCRQLDAAECERRRSKYTWKVYCAMSYDADPTCRRRVQARQSAQLRAQ
jgi:soluble lytic murein transglycosylase-like protein